MNNSKKIIFFSFISLLFFVGQFALKNSFASAENGNKTLFFNKDMRIGDKNEDVRALQKILNKNPATKVSSSGAGSLGNESDFFGQLTKNAVIKFQELHKSDILRPFDLKFGTGFVGIATRLKLNSLLEADTGSSSISMIVNSSSLSKYSSKSSQSSASSKIKKMSAVMPAVSSSETFSSSSSENSTVVRVYSPSEYQISPAKNLILEGGRIYFDLKHNSSWKKKIILFLILTPMKTGLKYFLPSPNICPLVNTAFG